MDIKLWTRWVAQHAVPKLFMGAQARRGNPLAQLIVSHGRGVDPYPLMEAVRAQGPLVRSPFVWSTADHAVCREILRDKRFAVTPPAGMDLPRPLRALLARTDPGVANPVEPPAMVIVDPPDHTRYRQLVAQSFTPRAIDTLGQRVAEVTAELVEKLSVAAQPDLITDYAAAIPVAMIADILGLPAETHGQLLQWGHDGAPLLDIGIPWQTYRRAIDGLCGFDRYLTDHFHQVRTGAVSDNPFTRMAADHTLTDRELIANAALLVGAGFETTVNLIGNGVVLLLQHPDQLTRLRENPDLWPAAVEEILRIDSPVQMTARSATCDVEIADQHVRAGDMVVLLLGGANRDPRVFPDPARFDITRANAREHLAFASGIHACLGAALARIEGVTALRALFDAYPDLQLTGAPQPRGLVNLHGYRRLPAHLGNLPVRPRA
ncbi:cytochrome P450 [Mycobacterium frederiksbergense]|uniref:Cytochrome P450 n=1 Tax=Mycolicibacterium frederiksbergense TaxID=117567 RepID=A0ABT6KYI9_9MYCO|nr:cytochrome P450 [Mycolicibacterium frederiksbergense]MDH6195765.1 cytochrome P450 [Mycolicibacterium frederiksbergense]